MFESCFEICRLLANAEIPFELFYRAKNAYIGVYREEKVTIKRITDILSSVCVFVFITLNLQLNGFLINTFINLVPSFESACSSYPM